MSIPIEMEGGSPMRYRVIEVDTLTGNERDLLNYATEPWSNTATLDQAKEMVAWREANITPRYRYRIEDADGEEVVG